MQYLLTTQKGAPGVLDIYRVSGKVMTLSRKVAWRSQLFQIKDGFLNYYRQELVIYSDCIAQCMGRTYALYK